MTRDFVGYGGRPPVIEWPGGARLAINLALNYEEGSERSPLLGDDARDSRTWSKSALPPSERDLIQEGEFEYGSRAGIWRLLSMFEDFDVPFSVFASSQALRVHPGVAEAFRTANCDMVSHGVRSISRPGATPVEERSEIRGSIDEIAELTGKTVLGSFPRPPISPATRRIMAEEGLLYDCATTNDDLPYFAQVEGRPMLVMPYSLDQNDARFWGGATGPGFMTGDDFYDYLMAAFRTLLRDSARVPTMMTIGLHARIMRPGRVDSLYRFLESTRNVDVVAFSTRNDLAVAFAEQFAPENTWNWPLAERS